MAIIYSYPTVAPTADDLVLGTDVNQPDKPTKNFSIQSIVDLVQGTATGLAAVLLLSNDAGQQAAINFTNVQGTGTFTAGSFVDGTMSITGGVGAGFTSFESTSFTGKLDAASFNQDNIRTLGTLTSLKVGNATPAITSIVTVFTNPGDNVKLATTKAIVDYIATKPNPETLAETLANGDVSGGANNIVMQGAISNITFQDSNAGGTKGKALFGTSEDLEIHHDGTDSFVTDLSTGDLRLRSDNAVKIQASTGGNALATFTKTAGVDLYFNNVKKFETLSTGATITGVTTSTGVFRGPNGTTTLPTYGFTSDGNTGMYGNGNGEVKLTSNGNSWYIFGNASAVFSNDPNITGTPSLLFQSDTFTTTTTLLKTPMTRFVKSTDPSDPATTPATTGMFAANLQVDTMVPTVLAVKTYADTVAGAKTLDYEGDATGPFALNLTDDDFKIAGGTNIGTVATTVAANVGTLTVNLDDSISLTGSVTANTGGGALAFSDGTFSGAAGTYTGGVSIESDLFVGDATASLLAPIPPNAVGTPNNVQFQGNASSANRLGPSDGTIQLLVGTGATLGVSSGAVKYTDGGDITIATSLLNTTVTGKTLQGLPTPAAATVVAADTILEGIGKLQSQINGIANGLQFQGTWNASMDTGGADVTPNGTPALTSGGGEASSGTTDTTTADELVDSTKNFTVAPNIVAVGDKVINQADGQEALVTAITNAASGRLELAADIMLTGEAYIIDKTPFITAGHYYVVDAVGATTARNATLNGIQDWQVGDWVIASINNVWQKLNNSAVEGSGTENRLTKWAATASTLVDSGIIDDGTTIKLQNDTELGAASTDAISSVGVHTIDEQLILKKGLGLLLSDGATPPVFSNNYGTSGQVLTSAGASSDTPTWTTPTIGVVESITGGTGITVDDTSDPGTAAIPVVSVDYLGTDNIILSAGTAVTPVGADTIIINDATNGNVVKALISNLPFNNYSWDLNVNGGTASTVVDGNEVDFLSGTGIIQSLSTRDVTTALRYEDVNNDPATGALNFIDASTAATPVASDFLIFSDQETVNFKTIVKKATIADIVDLGNETLTQVLANGNNSGGAKDINMTGAVSNITLVDSGTAAALNAAQGRIKIGSGDDLQLYHNGTSSFIANATGDLNISSNTSIKLSFLSGEAALLAIKDNQLNLYYNGLQRMNTSSAGITVSGTITSGDVNTSGLLGSRVQLARNAVPTVNNILGTIGFRGDAFGGTTLSVIDTAAIQASAEIDWAANVYGTRLTFKTTTGQTQSTALTLRGDNDAEFTGNVEIDGNLTVDGAIINGGGGSGTHTAKGGTFSDTIVCSLASPVVATEAFTISRAANGTMVFDVYFTNDTNGTDSSVAKKFTVVKQYGSAESTISSFKILDTGPGTFSSNTIDFTPEFKVSGTSNIKLKCMITPVAAAQTVTYTIVLGAGSQDATIVLN